MSPDDPEPQIAATALIVLWPIQFRSLGKRLQSARTPEQVHQAVTVDVRRAAKLIEAGLTSFRALRKPPTPMPVTHPEQEQDLPTR
ncbi:hypothetical protein AB0P17_27110 [Streptomyces sp. NPDC088124]|uniref:hypothetical protein n=1 Tax=Streptomyces sp. NPDC088124 TaxID=3154654 RepID=UPI0034446C2B